MNQNDYARKRRNFNDKQRFDKEAYDAHSPRKTNFQVSASPLLPHARCSCMRVSSPPSSCTSSSNIDGVHIDNAMIKWFVAKSQDTDVSYLILVLYVQTFFF